MSEAMDMDIQPTVMDEPPDAPKKRRGRKPKASTVRVEFWRTAFIAALRNYRHPKQAAQAADRALVEFEERFGDT
jgi:hypothetical protein